MPCYKREVKFIMKTFIWCIACGKEVPASYKSVIHSHLIKGERICVEQETLVCPVCGKEFTTLEVADKSQKKAYQIYRKSKGLLSPEEIKGIRQKYGLSQGLFARILGFGEKTITRYENGYLPDPAQSNLIMLVANENSFLILWNLRKAQFTEKEQKRVEVQLKLLGEKKLIPKADVKKPEITSVQEKSNFRQCLTRENINWPPIESNLYSDFTFSWYSLKRELVYCNRYFPRSSLLNDLHGFFQYVTVYLSNTANILLYRARERKEMELTLEGGEGVDYNLLHILKYNPDLVQNYHTDDILESLKKDYPGNPRIGEMQNGFYGYNAKDSGAPPTPRLIQDGRANPDHISYLYLAEDPQTAIAEISPAPSSWISIGLFKLNQPLKLLDLGYTDEMSSPHEYIQLSHQISLSFSLIAKDFSDYYITQYISEYVKSKNYDGIIYNSSVCPGKNNIVLFYSDKVCAIGSELYEVEGVQTISHRMFPLENSTLSQDTQ